MSVRTKNQISFQDLKPGMAAKIIGCSECGEELRRLKELGLTPGAEFQIIKVAPMGDPVEINLRGYRLCLRKRENCSLILESIEEESDAVESKSS